MLDSNKLFCATSLSLSSVPRRSGYCITMEARASLLTPKSISASMLGFTLSSSPNPRT
uniref:Uncharacterized protein n=1 Tax=Arundo donax TaxID=35708 RepID=A0A0A9F3T2_ARUDO